MDAPLYHRRGSQQVKGKRQAEKNFILTQSASLQSGGLKGRIEGKKNGAPGIFEAYFFVLLH
jgi:hypothetical protein